MMPVLSLRGVAFGYTKGNMLFSDVCMDMQKGENIALTGATGCGKTTLLSIICGLQKPNSGEVLINGLPVSDMKLCEIGKRIGYVRQNPERQLFASSVEEELMFALTYRGESQEASRAAAQKAMETFSIAHLGKRAPCLLSRGEKQRVCLAACILLQPDVFVMDEPTAALDPVMRAQAADVFKKQRQAGRGVMMVTHDKDFASACCDRMLELRQGSLREI